MASETTLNKNAMLGFRSNKLWKKIVSISYLCICGLIFVASMFIGRAGQITVYDHIIDKIFYALLTVWLITPYMFLSNTKLRAKLPLFRQCTRRASILGMTIVSVVIFVLFAITFALHSPEYQADMANHAYITTSSVEPTCEEDGKIQYLCTYCEKTLEEKISAKGHSFKEISRKEPTYSENGEIINQCELCQKTETITLDKLIDNNATTENSDAQKNPTMENPDENQGDNNPINPPDTDNNDNSTDNNNDIVEELSDYQKLSDTQFSLLTEFVAKSFYSFTLEQADYEKLSNDSDVMDCLKKIYDYAYNNYFELDPKYKKAVSLRSEVVSNISNYQDLQSNFIIEHYRDAQQSKWIYTITSYSINPQDTTKVNDVLYVDAEGYLNPGVILYWKEDGNMVKVGEIEDIAYKKEINGVVYGYAIKINYYDDPYSSGWYDGEHMLTTNKKLSGKPLFYINALDANRRVAREEIDYSSGIKWKLLSKSNAKAGVNVYSGILNSKSFAFTIVSVDSQADTMLVKYANGNLEVKSYSAMLNLGYLYIK